MKKLITLALAAISFAACNPNEPTAKQYFTLWNDCEALTALQACVQDVTNPQSANFIPVSDRIATFDMDGTFVGELATTGCGAILAWLLRLTTKERRTLVIEIGMQNAAQAITIACSPLIFNNEIIAIPAIIYALMMNLILLAYGGITTIQKQ